MSLFLSCSAPLQPNPESVSADYCIYLTGKVLKKDGTPLKNAIIRFNGLPYSDSADSSGTYLIKLRKDSASTGLKNVLANGSYTDTLSFVISDQTIRGPLISHWVDTLPDVAIAEIKIAVDFGSDTTRLLKTVAVIARQEPSTVPDDRIIDLTYIPPTHRYEGFAYLVHQSGSSSYSIRVTAYGPDSILLGQSKTLVFSSQDNVIALPFFNPRNAVPVCNAGNTQRMSINDSFYLKATAVDSFGVIVKWEWDIGNTGDWVEVIPDSGYAGIAPATVQKDFPCILRVTNNNGAVARDTMLLQIETDPPVPAASVFKTTVSINDTLSLLGSVSDSFGHIVSWEWDAGNKGEFIDVTPDSGLHAVAPGSPVAQYPCVLRVTDDDGNTAFDTVFITIAQDLPVPAASAEKLMVSIGDTIRLLGTASDGFGKIVEWAWDEGCSGYFSVVVPDSGSIAIAPNTAMDAYPCVLRVTDDDENIALDTVLVAVVQDPPVPAASAEKKTVSIGDTIRLLGTASDAFGKIVTWAWDAGTTGFFTDTSPDSACSVVAPDTAIERFQCVLQVTDDDGNSATDTVSIAVTAPPIVDSLTTTAVKF